MTSIVEAGVPADRLALGGALRALPETTVTVVQAAAHGDGTVLPVLSVDQQGSRASQALRDDASVAGFETLAALAEESVYRVAWASAATEHLETVLPDDGVVLRARATDGRWCFRLLFGDRDRMEAWSESCLAADLGVDVESVRDPIGSVRSRECALSRKQYVTLETALRAGFYDIPRRVTLEELADEFDVTHQALSERLSRAHRSTVANVVSTDFPLVRVE